MEITIKISTDNAAFDTVNDDGEENRNNARPELSRILAVQADKVRLYPLDGLSEPFTIRDCNGNAVGTFEVS